jgi:type I restriction enzyme M protein
LSHDDIQKIADTYHAWRTADPSVRAHCIRPAARCGWINRRGK